MVRDRRMEVSELGTGERGRRPEPIAVLGRGRVVLTGATVLLALLAYFRSTQGPLTVAPIDDGVISLAQEIALGQRAGPFLAARHGGLTRDEHVQREIARIGEQLVYRNRLEATGNQFRFYVLADTESVDFFALPGGAIYLTSGALNRLTTEGEIASVLAHALAHVVQGHPLQLLHEVEALPGIRATAILAEIDPTYPGSLDTDRVRRLVETTIPLAFNPRQLAIADQQMLVYLGNAGYHPQSMVQAWEKMLGNRSEIQQVGFEVAYQERIERLRQLVADAYPQGIPASLIP